MSNLSHNPNPLLTVEEAAEYANRTPGTLRWLLSKGKGPKSGKVGGRRMIRLSDLDAWINEGFEEKKESVNVRTEYSALLVDLNDWRKEYNGWIEKSAINSFDAIIAKHCN